MNVVLPFRGEFGLKLRYHVPAVHAFPEPKVVCAEPGEEALYPSAEKIVAVPPNHDDRRRDSYAKDRDEVERWRALMGREYPGATFIETHPKMPQSRFLPEPRTRLGLAPDVVICPRRRSYGASKNWPHWGVLLAALKARGLDVFAAGAPDSSYELDCPNAWVHARYLDASIEAMRSARVVIATDAGLAHLAVFCGRSLLLIGYGGGLVAPGPVVDDTAKMVKKAYWPIRLQHYYHEANHMGAPITLLRDGWDRPEDVARHAARLAA